MKDHENESVLEVEKQLQKKSSKKDSQNGILLPILYALLAAIGGFTLVMLIGIAITILNGPPQSATAAVPSQAVTRPEGITQSSYQYFKEKAAEEAANLPPVQKGFSQTLSRVLLPLQFNPQSRLRPQPGRHPLLRLGFQFKPPLPSCHPRGLYSNPQHSLEIRVAAGAKQHIFTIFQVDGYWQLRNQITKTIQCITSRIVPQPKKSCQKTLIGMIQLKLR